jgi:hypothetical protein
MKRSAISIAVFFAASLTQAQSQPATKPAQEKPVVLELVDPKAAPAKPVVPAKTPVKKVEKKKEVEPVIPGANLTRANGTFLGLEVIGGKFKLTFYDKKKKPMAVDVTRANARWPNKRSATAGDYRTVLNGSGTALVGERPVQPPYVFNVYLTLLQGEGDDAKAVENYVVPFHD